MNCLLGSTEQLAGAIDLDANLGNLLQEVARQVLGLAAEHCQARTRCGRVMPAHRNIFPSSRKPSALESYNATAKTEPVPGKRQSD